MQFKAIALTSFLGLAAAASSSDVASLATKLPSCSLPCLVQGASAAGCAETDYSCQCENEAVITANATSCLTTSCSVSDIGTTKTVSTEICAAVDGSSTSSSTTASNSTATGTSTSASSTSSGGSSSSSSSSSAGTRNEFYGLGFAALAALAGLMVM